MGLAEFLIFASLGLLATIFALNLAGLRLPVTRG